MAHYILTRGDEIIAGDANIQPLMPKYKEQLEVYSRYKLPSEEPAIWKKEEIK